ncbi:hypothetical protein T01_4191 [Trichinella spiralis]|uniref:Uncharacterized protein n=1 Tax=Trichinella spiralis TaxID=6334 RepID=A0A0V1BPS9_TRISP|nr:hypothetical protein T01_4191 [Trichinella spiralis]
MNRNIIVTERSQLQKKSSLFSYHCNQIVKNVISVLLITIKRLYCNMSNNRPKSFGSHYLTWRKGDK